MDASPALVVGVGASAGGLDACQRFLRGAPADQGMAFVVVLHLAPAQESHVAGILQKATLMPVSQITGEDLVEPDHVYVIAPATSLGIRERRLEVGAPEEPHYRARPVDAFFSSLAADQKEAAVAVVLSGTGRDGSAGLVDVRSGGGLCLVQEPETAEFDGMPRSAIETGAADAVVPPEEMGAILLRYAAVPRVRPAPGEPEPQTIGSQDPGLTTILELLGKRSRVDFRDYKTGTLQRRTQHRMELHRLPSWQDYLDYMEEHPAEADELYRDLLIGVTSFFRDAEEWQLLAREIVPALAAPKDGITAVRVWSAGCASGEEAYSLAMIFLEQLEIAANPVELKVFASDASDSALGNARRGRYPASIEERVSAGRLRRFFQRAGEGFEVGRTLRDAVTFAAHDLLSDPPFAHLDLVCCRNVLIYLEPAAQERLLERFHFSLRPGGVLWLGASETVGRRTDLFEAVSGQHRIYRPVGLRRHQGYHRARRAAESAALRDLRGDRAPTEAEAARRVEKLVLQRYALPCVVIDHGLEILYFFGPTEEYLTRPNGEARLDLLSWVRPELYAKLRTGLAEAVEHQRRVTVPGIRLEGGEGVARVEIVIEPIRSVARAGGRLLVVFRDLAARPAPGFAQTGGSADAGAFTGQIRSELEDTREELRTAVDQLRTLTEEHGARYEEILSLNEEFQSSNEELEASKEELQSLNEELATINRQLEERNEELRALTSDLDNLLVSANVPTLFLDRELRIRRFTPACTSLLRIAPADLGRPLADIKMDLEDDALQSDAARVLLEPAPIEAEVSTADGRWFLRRALPYRTEGEEVDGVCLAFHEITLQKQAAAASEDARLYAEAIIRTSRTPLLVLDMKHRVRSANAAFCSTFQVGEEETAGRWLHELGDGQWDIPGVRELLAAVGDGQGEIRDYDLDQVFQRVGWRSIRLNADTITRSERPDLILLSIEDVTDLRKAEMIAKSRADDLVRDDQRKNEFLAILGHELRNPLAAISSGLHLMDLTGDASTEPVRTMMERQTRRIAGMLDQLLDVARVISGKFELAREAADVTEVARAAIESVQPMLEAAGQKLTISLPPEGTALVLGDPVRLAQVIENLLGNAVKYTGSEDGIWLTVEVKESTIKLSVRDTGVGMEPAVLEHVFDMFLQGRAGQHGARGGLGIGLSLVRSLVRMHGGSVEAFSSGPGQGTEVVVTLPRLRRRRLASAGDERAAADPTAPRRILVVDDEVDAAEALVEILTLRGHQARAAADLAGALTVAAELEPEVVLLDLGLPDTDGYQVARKLRELLGPRPLLLALTGYQDDRVRREEAGFDGHLLKPTDLQKLSGWLARADRRDEAAAPA